jgi:ParB-like chromosome segregation protein Spo0J
VPTISIDHLSEAQAQAFMIADNRLTENSTWDDRLLGEQLKVLSELQLDFSLEVTGFEMGEIDLHIERLEVQPENDDPADTLPEPRTGPPISRAGDLWLLDRHQVHCAARSTKRHSRLSWGQTGPRWSSPIRHITFP